MGLVTIEPEEAEARLDYSRDGLRRAAPQFSAARLLDRRQKVVLLVVLVAFTLLLLLAPLGALTVLVGICTVVYLITVVQRVVITVLAVRTASVVVVTDEEALAVPDHELPRYTVMVPAYGEPAVIQTLLANLHALDYPADKLDIKVLLEADDQPTIEAATDQRVMNGIDIVLVPPGEPRTKPKALNYGLTLATGELVTIYDAEDHPDPLQLRRAAVAFRRLPPDVACLQAQLTYFNTDQNLITRWFTTEYLMWFSLFLPGLTALDAPLPLGGTSNHIRRSVLDDLGGWDPYNVTEDADLGVRLHRQGYRVEVLNSPTYEEANSDFVNWMKQRSRWYKGYLQTWLVHLRHPVELWRELGPRGFFQFNLFVGGTPLLALLNPLFWGLTLAWFLGNFHVIQQLFPAPIYYMGLFCWAVGNFTIAYLTVLAARRSGRPSLVFTALIVPIYWLMMSISAIKAFWQLIATPSYWEKTTHGLDADRPTPAAAAAWAEAADDLEPDDRSVTPRAPWVTPAVPPTLAAAAPQPVSPRRLNQAGRVLRGFGFCALGLVLYLIVGTGWQADRAQADLGRQLAHAPASGPTRPGQPVGRLVAKDAGINTIVVEGVGVAQLDKAAGHAPGWSFPGGNGHVLVVGRRVTSGAPFAHLDRLQRGNIVSFETPWGIAEYQVTGRSVRTMGQIDDTPDPRRLTLVTSAHGLSSADQLVVEADLISPLLGGAPHRSPGMPERPHGDGSAFIVLLGWGAVAYGLIRARHWLRPRWGRVGSLALLLPLAVVLVVGASIAIGHLLPVTW